MGKGGFNLMDVIRFTLNGREVEVANPDAHVTLLEYVRSMGLTGTKEGCAEGECGACAVALRGGYADASARYDAVNSCLVLLPAVHGREVWTVEALAQDGRLHPVQEALVNEGGSQCGYCTAGFVMSMFAEYYRPGRQEFDVEVLGGNLCRCTGYRPIRDAARSLGAPEPDDSFLIRLQEWSMAEIGARDQHGATEAGSAAEGATEATTEGTINAHGNSTVQGEQAAGTARPAGRGATPRFLRPGSLSELVAVLGEYPEACLIAGGTDLVVERNLRRRRWPVLVSVEAVPELQVFDWSDGLVEIGAGLPLSAVEARIAGRLPILEQVMPLFASRLIRNRATLGGNLATASPIGDGAPALLAVDGSVRLVSEAGDRIVPLTSFFTGYRSTVLAPGEVLASVRIPLPLPGHTRFYKVAKRERDDISIVAAAFALDMNADGTVTRARLAYGGVAATPVRAYRAERVLEGRPWNSDALRAAQGVLETEFEPISDHRGSAAYRRALVQNLLERFYLETAGVVTCAS